MFLWKPLCPQHPSHVRLIWMPPPTMARIVLRPCPWVSACIPPAGSNDGVDEVVTSSLLHHIATIVMLSRLVKYYIYIVADWDVGQYGNGYWGPEILTPFSSEMCMFFAQVLGQEGDGRTFQGIKSCRQCWYSTSYWDQWILINMA